MWNHAKSSMKMLNWQLQCFYKGTLVTSFLGKWRSWNYNIKICKRFRIANTGFVWRHGVKLCAKGMTNMRHGEQRYSYLWLYLCYICFCICAIFVSAFPTSANCVWLNWGPSNIWGLLDTSFVYVLYLFRILIVFVLYFCICICVIFVFVFVLYLYLYFPAKPIAGGWTEVRPIFGVHSAPPLFGTALCKLIRCKISHFSAPR